jgi:hypothetical protein
VMRLARFVEQVGDAARPVIHVGSVAHSIESRRAAPAPGLDKVPCDKYSCDKTYCERRCREMNQNPALLKALTEDRVAELRRSAAAARSGRAPQRGPGVIDAARRRTGWLLIDTGLRLAPPRGALARGQR